MLKTSTKRFLSTYHVRISILCYEFFSSLNYSKVSFTGSPNGIFLRRWQIICLIFLATVSTKPKRCVTNSKKIFSNVGAINFYDDATCRQRLEN